MPKCTASVQDITLTAKSTSTLSTNSISFTYNAVVLPATINSISPNSFNPSLKGILQIVGTGFGTDLSIINVSLYNASGNVYPMRVLSVNDTNIKAGIMGGLPGKFEVKVYKTGIGAIPPSSRTATQFTY